MSQYDPYGQQPGQATPPPPPPGGPYGGGYGAAPGGYGWGAMPQEHPNGTTILVLGILSLVCCGLLGPVAWVMGRNALRQIDASGVLYGNRGNIKAGMICGIVATALLIVGILVFGALVIAAVVAGDSSTSTTYTYSY